MEAEAKSTFFRIPSMLSDAFISHPYHPNHEDFTSFKELPESYRWTQLDDELHNKALCSNEAVPLINLEDPEAIKGIGYACKKWGVFQITNHGVSNSLLEQVEVLTKELFSLPTDKKLQVARQPQGISGYGHARISAFFSKLMWSEGFTIADSPIQHFAQLWPEDYNRYCDVITRYEKEVNKLSRRLMQLMVGSVGVALDEINWVDGGKIDEVGYSGSGSSGALQLNYYPPCPDPNCAMGLAPHTDSTLLTVLHQNTTAGLEVYKEDAGWIMVPPRQDCLVIHVGDLLHILSNGQFPSVLHRARVNSFKPRLSVAYLYGPPASVKISPLMKLVTPLQPPLYRPVTWTEYLGVKAKNFDKALSLVRVCMAPKASMTFDDRSSVQVG